MNGEPGFKKNQQACQGEKKPEVCNGPCLGCISAFAHSLFSAWDVQRDHAARFCLPRICTGKQNC